ncbi:E3 ubiquitin-protein ligase LRSAM1-like [Macrobrachium nipponense]|uniref:E3 ubiquitin-protein ligase LRSAM1-like n=1 Tax=Macrobrachium nipponense TaxID=159736 RepID=UPI0030C8640B
MPFGNFFKKEKNNSPSATMTSKEIKAKLGMKVVMAQQNPEPVYDLTDCYIVELPPDTFVMCKLLQKTSLLLRNNNLSSLEKGGKLHELCSLELLDLSNNKLSHLPESISKLKKLKVLKLSNNKIKTLPHSFSELRNLQELYLSSNRLSKVPTCICALPNLRVLTLKDNSITELPKEFCSLQKSLCLLEIDADKLQSPPPDVAEEGVEAVMRHLCEQHEIEYVGLSESVEEEFSESTSSQAYAGMETPEDDFTRNYMRKKDELLRAQLAAEEEFQAKERNQLAEVLRDMSNNKKHLLDELSQTPEEVIEYEKKKLRLLQDQYNVEESLRKEQEEQLLVYLVMSNTKDSFVKDLSAQQADIDAEVEDIVNSKDKDRKRLLEDLTEMERDTAAALHELLSYSATNSKNEEFLNLLNDQEKEMELMLSGIAEASAELRSSEVISAMQAALMEEAATEARRQALQDEQSLRVLALLEENDLVNTHLEGVMTSRMADQEVWASTLMEDEAVQAEAFKLLLLKNDLKRCSILRQIGQVEYELAKLSSLEMRKKKFDVKYGSTTMLDQRATLAGLLKSLLKEKSDREEELNAWFGNLTELRSSDCSEEEFWLIQYQRLLAMKPAGLVEAEEQLDPRIREILRDANAADLIPVFARHGITYEQLMEFTEEEALSMEIGPATYHGLQRALQNHLEEAKLGNPLASAPSESDLPYSPTAPDVELEGEEGASAPALELDDETRPTAPQFIEAECVVCLSLSCEVIFLPCGHMCVCAKCCAPLSLCPLCRGPVLSKVLKTF